MRLISHPSPNWNDRHSEIDAIVLHATADSDTRQSIDWCCTPAPKNPAPVSYHCIVDRDGTVYTLVPAVRRAWHAGFSSFKGENNCNDYAIGISFANNNSGEEYPEVQLSVAAAIVAGYMKRFPGITIDRITTHAVVRSEWNALHPDAIKEKKTDPSPPAFSLDDFKARVKRELGT